MMDVPFRPRIQAHDWPGVATSVVRSVCWMPRLGGTPWLSFYFETDGRLDYLSARSLQRLRMSAEKLEGVSVAAMVAQQVTWTEASNAPMRALQCLNDDFACERILDRAFLRAGAARLNSPGGLAVAMPERGRLLAVCVDAAWDLLPLAAALYAGAENQPISPWVFAVQDGLVTGRFYEENGELGVDAVIPPSAPGAPDPRSP